MKEMRASFCTRLKKLPWKNLRSFNWWLKLIGAIGSVGAFVAIFFLWCNLKEMQRQTDLENRGFFAMVLQTYNIRIDSMTLVFYYKYMEASRIPVVVKAPGLQMCSYDREINVPQFIADQKTKLKGSYLAKSVNVFTQLDSLSCGLPNSIQKGLENFSNKKSDSYNGKFFFHVMFKYEDITENNYWVYMRWKLEIKYTHAKDSTYWETWGSPDTYVIWKAKPEEEYPDTLRLPKELKELTKKARGK